MAGVAHFSGVVATPVLVPLPSWSATWMERGGWDEGLAEWRAAQALYSGDSLGSDPDWCRGLEAVYPETMRWVRVSHGAESQVVPWLLRRRELDCRLGEWAWLRFHPRLLQPAGEELGLPAQPEAYAAMMRTLLEQSREWDVMQLFAPTDSAWWRWLNSDAVAALGLQRYQPQAPSPRFLLQFPATFAEYTAKFTAKTRKNRERELRHLEQHGKVELRCYRRPEEVDGFLEEAGAVSRLSYQHKLLKTGLREAERLRPRLLVAAELGWLRSYTLRCGGETCSYMLGYQYQGRYNYTTIGYHPRWAALSAGTVLHWLALQEMFACDPPRLFDFGTCGAQKRYFANQQYEEGSLYLFRPGLYPWLVRSCHSGNLRVTRGMVGWLKRHNLKPAAQRWIRRVRGC